MKQEGEPEKDTREANKRHGQVNAVIIVVLEDYSEAGKNRTLNTTCSRALICKGEREKRKNRGEEEKGISRICTS